MDTLKILFSGADQNLTSRLYTPQHCTIPESIGCELTDEGYIKIDSFQETTIKEIYACDDNVTRMRTLANAVGMGTMVWYDCN